MDEQLDCGLLTQRTLNALHYAGIYTIKDVLQYTEIQLLKTDGIGRRAINEVKEILASKGFALPKVPVPKIPDYPNLRDHFAAAVITGIFAGKWGQVPNQKPEVAFAEIAFLVADEMLKARMK